MSQKVNLFNEAWVDLLFENRNQAYGAYELRKDSSRRHRWGIIASLIFFASVIWLPIIYKQITAKSAKEKNVEVTVLSNIEINKQPEKPKEIIVEETPPLKSSIKFTPPVIKPDEEVQEDEMIRTQEELTATDVNISIADVKGNDEENGMDIAELNAKIVEDTVEEVPYTYVEQMPEFPGGDAARTKYLTDNIKYPRVASENNIQGKVTLNFIVDKDGSISSIKVLRGVDPAIDAEAVRVVKAMPRWIPGKQNGEAVRVSFVLPINFQLN